jgi:hypothetical protein
MQSRRLRFDALEREQGEASLRAAADERLRIAQELHDVVAHSLGVIAVQAGVGMHVIDTDPAEARRSLSTSPAPAGRAWPRSAGSWGWCAPVSRRRVTRRRAGGAIGLR